MWTVAGTPVDLDQFLPFKPSEILYEFDGPRIFTFTNKDEELFLAYQCDEDESGLRFVIVPFSTELKARLVNGEVSVREALNQPRLWLMDVANEWKPSSAWRAKLSTLPEDALPETGVMLWHSLEPLISFRAIGAQIIEGMVPASVISSSVDGVKKAIKILVDYIFDQDAHAGRPFHAVRRYYDLPAQKFAFNSFEISFRRPAPEQDRIEEVQTADNNYQDEVFDKVGDLLRRGLKWLNNPPKEFLSSSPIDKEQRVILQAVMCLTPPAHGAVRTVEVSGSLVGESDGSSKQVVRLERGSRQLRKSELEKLHADDEEVVTPVGLIREADRDNYTFELREVAGEIAIMKFTFDEDLAEEVFDAFNGEYKVKVIGIGQVSGSVFEAKIIEKQDSARNRK